MKRHIILKLFLYDLMKISLLQAILAVIFTGVSLAHSATAQELLNRKVTLTYENQSIRKIFDKIEKQTDVRFAYRPSILPSDYKVSVMVISAPLSEVLDKVVTPLNLKYDVVGQQIILSPATVTPGKKDESLDRRSIEAISNEQTISGKVSDEKGVGLPGVSVVIKGTQQGTTTNLEGVYTINSPKENLQLIFSYVGFITQEISTGNRNVVDVLLKPDEKSLEEIVVVGYGTQSRRNVTGAVARVDMKTMENLPTTNVTQALRGRVAGVQFIDNGRPGQEGSILVRGRRSISAGNDPLIVLDGIFFNGSLADISPNDIESMEVLKDASAAAIYGSRAANGVILITSKKGKTEKPTIRVNTYYGFSNFSKRLKMLTPERYIQKTLDYRRQNGQDADPAMIESYLQAPEAENYRAGRSIDPWDAISQTASLQSHDVSISGRSERSNYFISGSVTDEKGLIFNDNSKRYAFRVNSENKIMDWLSIGLNAQFTSRDMSGQEASTYNAYWLSPFAQLYYDEGKTDPVPFPVEDQLVANPMNGPLLTKDLSISENLFANFYVKLDIPFIKGLNYRLNYSPNYRWSRDYNFSPIYQRNGINNTGSGNKSAGRNFDWVVENILNYNKQFGDHALDVTLLYGRNKFTGENTNALGANFTGVSDVLTWNNLNLAAVQSTTSSASQVDAISSMARLNYRFKDRYLLTLTARRDASSVFSESNKYATFPSAALAWIASEESFIKQISSINLLKLRISYGAVGNQAISPYQTLSRGGTVQYVYGDGGPTSIGTYASGIGNSNLKWETTYSANFAIDFELFKNRIGGTVEYYNMSTRNLILTRSLPSPTGFSQILDNLGEVSNKGIELTLNTLNLSRGKFEWSSNLVFSSNRNRIVHLYGSDNNGDGKEDDDLGNRWFIGQPVQVNYDYTLDGVYQVDDEIPTGYKAGFFRIKDINGDGKTDSNDRSVLSQGEAKYRWGLTNNFKYGNFTLSVFLNAMTGWTGSFTLLNPKSNFPGRPANMIDAGWWTPENRSDTSPSLVYTNPLGQKMYASRNFLRVQDVSLAYDFPRSMVSKLRISSLRGYVSGRNLLTFTHWPGFDPENGDNSQSAFPSPRTFACGLNISF
jgi:TonB-linked SusC/RagA family outer membrane protein